MNRQLLLLTVFIQLSALGCATSATFETRRASSLQSNLTPQETQVVLADAAAWIKQENDRSHGRLSAVVFDSVRAEQPMLVITGCGAFGGRLFGDRWMVSIIAVREEAAWRMHSWQVDTDGLHGPPLPCR